MAVKIDKDIHEKCMIDLKNEYVRTFGIESFNNTNKKYNKQEYIVLYAENKKFWEQHLPNIDINNPSSITQVEIAKHAICTNSIQNLSKKIKEMNIEKEIEEHLFLNT